MKGLICSLLMLLSTAASAHPLAPALLQLQEIAPAQYTVLWRSSVTRAQQLDVTPLLPVECLPVQAVQTAIEGGDAVVTRWRVQCDAQGLAQRVISVQGLAQSGINVILQLTDLDDRVQQALLGPDQPTYTVTAPTAQRPVFASYLQLGVQHLLTGLDHLLFVTGLWLLVRGRRALLVTLTAFTLGHSLTLALASLGLIHVKQNVAELGIALSILLLATEVLRPVAQPPSLFSRRPWQMAAGFGLLHGLGFAGALAQVGLPERDIAAALLAFNIGIEAGQLLWLCGLLLLMRMNQWLLPTRLGMSFQWRMLSAYGIGTLAAFWCYQRSIGLLS